MVYVADLDTRKVGVHPSDRPIPKDAAGGDWQDVEFLWKGW